MTEPNRIITDLHRTFKNESEIVGEQLLFPDMGVTVRAEVSEFTDEKAVLYFYLNCALWDREMFECSAAFGATQDKAFASAMFPFTFGFLRGVKWLMRDSFGCAVHCDCESYPEALTSEFCGQQHRFTAYRSDSIMFGEAPKGNAFWDAVRDGVSQRLGNQKVSWVKLFAAKNGDYAVGECRLNDTLIPELSATVENLVRQWDTKGFGSFKQMVFLAQDADTYTPYPHTQSQIKAHTRAALNMFPEYENVDDWRTALAQKTGDDDLAAEICAFLPELCAINAFPDPDYDEKASFRTDKWEATVFLTQPAGYYAVRAALYDAFAAGAVSNETYSGMISISSIYNVMNKAREDGADLTKKGCRISVSFGFGDGYVLR